jgi:isopentenyl diphosphate isomerase/L-lactate dehydrogenase-like FMN-dependent dehydrogenase
MGARGSGADGVKRVVEILRLELEAAMALLGAPSLAGARPRRGLWPEG